MPISPEGKLIPLGHQYESASKAKKNTALLRKVVEKSTTIEQIAFPIRWRLRDLVCLITFALVGCAGSLAHTSSLSSAELRSVDTSTLCKAYMQSELSSPSYVVISEVRRRGEDCKRTYTYRSMMAAVNTGTVAYNSAYGAPSTSNQSTYNPPPGYRTCVQGWMYGLD